jgi:penicillin-insensitive murein endopeptidase
MRAFLLRFACGLALAACAGPGSAGSFGAPNAGMLRAGEKLALRGEGFVLARPTDPTRFGTQTLVGALSRAFASVAKHFPGTPPMRVGDLSYPQGGQHPRHGSHRSGRDADLIFHATDAAGMPISGSGFLAYDRFGVARAPSPTSELGLPSPPASLTAARRPLMFDVARNWHFVRTLLLDDASLVQWLFCSRGIKALLLRYAAQHEPEPEALLRAASALHQPSQGRPHDDHFHIRVLCTAEESSAGCTDYGPVWPWLRDRVEKIGPGDGEALDDATLVRLLLEELPVGLSGERAPFPRPLGKAHRAPPLHEVAELPVTRTRMGL